MLRQDLLNKMVAADREYAANLEEGERLRALRDATIMEATDAGATRAEVASVLGITPARVQQIIERVRRG